MEIVFFPEEIKTRLPGMLVQGQDGLQSEQNFARYSLKIYCPTSFIYSGETGHVHMQK